MSPRERHEFAADQLDRILGFFPRVDAKASALLAIDTALLAVMCLNLRPADFHDWIIAPAAVTAGIILVSLYFVFQCTLPYLAGGEGSLIYFREIAKRTEAKFIDDLTKTSEEQLTRDLLGQVWRNSQILKIKFDAVRVAFILTLIALIPLCVFLAAAGLYHGQVPSLG